MRRPVDGHHGEAGLDLSAAGFKLFQDLPDGVASLLSGDRQARVDDQSHVRGEVRIEHGQFPAARSRTVRKSFARDSVVPANLPLSR